MCGTMQEPQNSMQHIWETTNNINICFTFNSAGAHIAQSCSTFP
jgi:hypothetical protein